jgi:hypothetical protein
MITEQEFRKVVFRHPDKFGVYIMRKKYALKMLFDIRKFMHRAMLRTDFNLYEVLLTSDWKTYCYFDFQDELHENYKIRIINTFEGAEVPCYMETLPETKFTRMVIWNNVDPQIGTYLDDMTKEWQKEMIEDGQ